MVMVRTSEGNETFAKCKWKCRYREDLHLESEGGRSGARASIWAPCGVLADIDDICANRRGALLSYAIVRGVSPRPLAEGAARGPLAWTEPSLGAMIVRLANGGELAAGLPSQRCSLSPPPAPHRTPASSPAPPPRNPRREPRSRRPPRWGAVGSSFRCSRAVGLVTSKCREHMPVQMA